MKIRHIIATTAIVTLSPLVTLHMGQLRAEENSGDRTPADGQSMPSGAGIHLKFEPTLLLAENTATRSQSPATASSAAEQSRLRLKLSKSIDNLDPASQASELPGTDTSSSTTAATEPADATIIEGDSMEVYLDRKMKAIGNASISRNQQTIYGDNIEYDVQNEEMHVEGNARIEAGDATITGPSLRMRMGESIGEMIKASFVMKQQFSGLPQIGAAKATDVLNRNYNDPNEAMAGSSQQVFGQQNIEDNASYDPTVSKKSGMSRGDADSVFFEGEGKKKLKGARYTTCEADSDDWYIKASELKLDDYSKTATARNARVDFKGVPILYTPWISFSFLNQRKSGLLSPTWGTTSRSGFELLTPFYWNISPNMDATVATRLLTKRGLQLQGEFRYMGDNYSGMDSLEYLPSDSNTGDSRYYMNFKHLQSFGNGWSAGYNFEKVSDDQYFSDMSTRIVSTSRVNLPQQANVSYSDEVWSFNAFVQKYQTLNSTNNPSLTKPYDRLPQLSLNGNKDFGAFNADIKTEFVSFDRDPNSPRFTTTSTGGLFTTGVTGNRVTAYPSISLPMAQPYGYVTPKIGVRSTSYGLSNEAFTLDGVSGQYQSGNMTVPIFSVDSGLFFDRNVRVVKNNYTQTLEPRLFYVYIPYQDQSQFPVFDTASADLNLGTLFLENQFTGNDRINNANQISLAVTSRMINAKTGEQRLAVTVGQRFYFADQKVGLPGQALRNGDRSDFVAAATAKLANHWNIDTAWQYNTDNSQTVKANIGARYNPEPGKVLNLSYRYTLDSLEQYNISGQWPFGKGFYGLGRWNYSLSESQPIEGLAGVEYDAGCWQARAVLQRVATATASANYALFFQLELGGLASIGSNPMKLLNRAIPGYNASGLLPDNYRQQNYE